MESPGPDLRVLLVDDDPIFLSILAESLELAGIRADVAGGGERALEMLATGVYDLLVTDKTMAGLDGHALIQEVSRRHPALGAVMMTGHRSRESVEMAKQQRVLAYLEKPFADIAEVAAMLRRLAREHRERLGRT